MSGSITLHIPIPDGRITAEENALHEALRVGGHRMAGRVDLTDVAISVIVEDCHEVARQHGVHAHIDAYFSTRGSGLTMGGLSDTEATLVVLAYPDAHVMEPGETVWGRSR